MPDRNNLRRAYRVMRAKKAVLEREHLQLEKLRAGYESLSEELEISQKEYMEGVRKINDLRKSVHRTNLSVMEKGVDTTKNAWVGIYRKRQEVSHHMERQRDLVLGLQKQMKDLEERYQSMLRVAIAHDSRKEDQELTGLSLNHRYTRQKNQE